MDHRQRVERALGKRPFAPRPGRRWTLAGKRANVIHHQFGEFVVMDRIVERQGSDPGGSVRRIVSTPRENCRDRERNRCIRAHPSKKLDSSKRYVPILRIDQVGAILKVSRILRGLAID